MKDDQGNYSFLQALEGEIGLNDNPIATGSLSHYDGSAYHFEGFETPRSKGAGPSFTAGDT